VGEIAIVFTDIVHAMALWEFNARAMRDTTIIHNKVLRSSLDQFDGYEVPFSKCDSFSSTVPCADTLVALKGWKR